MSMFTNYKSKSGGSKDWCIRVMPQFPKGTKVFVLPGAFYGSVVTLLAEAGMERAASVEDCDVVAFIGGADINPSLYDEKNVKAYGINTVRDNLELATYKKAVELKKTCFGICRGAQFLHAVNGGKLWQDVNNHGGRDHYVIDLDEDVRFLATSIHHQMLQENDTMELVAVCEEPVATLFEDADLLVNTEAVGSNAPDILEVEAGAYVATRCFFVQGHPEVGGKEYRTWTMQKLLDYYLDWTGELRDIKEVILNLS